MISKTPASTRPAGWLLASLLALAPAAWAQEAAVTKRDTELREAPGDTGRSIAPLAAQTPVTRLPDRSGAWVQVRTAAGAAGWVQIFDLGPASGGASTSAPSESGGGLLRGVTGLFSRGGSGTPSGTSASGIRGLDAADLARAQPDTAAVAQMEALRQSDAEARDFAALALLQPVAVDPLPAPPRAASSGGGTDPSRP